MWQYLGRHAFQFAVRIGVTLVALLTIQNVVHQEGYFIEFKTLAVAAVVMIVALRLWMPWSKPASDRKFDNE